MVVGVLKIELLLEENRSLKGKRKVVRSMLDKVKARFNVAISEVGSNDLWQKIELGVSTVGNDRRHVNSVLSHVLSFLDSLYLAQIIGTQMEIINLNSAYGESRTGPVMLSGEHEQDGHRQ